MSGGGGPWCLPREPADRANQDLGCKAAGGTGMTRLSKTVHSLGFAPGLMP